MNIVVLRGVVRDGAEERELPSGAKVLAFDLRVEGPEERGESVPVAWSEGADAGIVAAGAEVVVVGRVRRRFFRSGGATQSRTEVVAERVVSTSQRRRVTSTLARVGTTISGG